MSNSVTDDTGEGSVTLCGAGWWAVMAALEGDESRRDEAFDALQRWAPPNWLEALDEREEHARATWTSEEFRTGKWVCG